MSQPEQSKNEFSDQLNEILETNFQNEHFGVSDLAREMNMSRSNLLRKVKTTTKLSATQYIRQARLKKAKEMLRQTSLTVSEVAYKVGFGGTSYFIKCFHEYYGYSPGEIGNREEVEIKISAVKAGKRKLVAFVTALLSVVIVLILFVVIKPFSSKNKELEKTIVVLPFIDDSPEKDNTHIINGLMESINNNLCAISDLVVKSRTSAEKYRNNPKLASEIAKELNVNYIVEGSGQKIKDRIILTVQLIEAPTDKHLWSHEYEKPATPEGFYEIRNEVAKAIVYQVQAHITPEEIDRIEKSPTESSIALEYYYKGLEVRNNTSNRSNNSWQEAIMYFEKAIENDNEFAEAYAELSLTYCALWYNYGWTDSVLSIANYYADKALFYDSKIDLALNTKGIYYEFIKKYDDAISYYEKALQYNPNSSFTLNNLKRVNNEQGNAEKKLEYTLAKIRISEAETDSLKLYDYIDLGFSLKDFGLFQEAEDCYNKALELEPDNFYVKTRIAELYTQQSKYNISLEKLILLYNRDSTEVIILRNLANSYFFTGNYKESYKYYKKHLAENENRFGLNNYNRLGFVCSQLGKVEESENYFKIFLEKIKSLNNPLNTSKYLSNYYAFKGETQKCFERLKIITEQNNFGYSVIKNLREDPMLENVRDLPEFKQIQKEIEDKFKANHQRIKADLTKKGLFPLHL